MGCYDDTVRYVSGSAVHGGEWRRGWRDGEMEMDGGVNPSGLRQSGFLLDETERASVCTRFSCVCVQERGRK